MRVLGFELVSLGSGHIGHVKMGLPSPLPTAGRGGNAQKRPSEAAELSSEGGFGPPTSMGSTTPHGVRHPPVRLTAIHPDGFSSQPVRLTAPQTHLFPSRGTPRPVRLTAQQPNGFASRRPSSTRPTPHRFLTRLTAPERYPFPSRGLLHPCSRASRHQAPTRSPHGVHQTGPPPRCSTAIRFKERSWSIIKECTSALEHKGACP